MEALDRELLRRMPLAEAALVLYRYVADDDHLHGLFERLRGRSYEKVLSFGNLVQLVHDALTLYGGSGRRSFEHARQRDELPVSIPAAYGKLRRLPVALSMGFLTECTDRLREVFPEQRRNRIPKSLRKFPVIVLDGKAIKRVAKRLKPLRKQRGGVLGGRALVALELSSGLALTMHAHPDGDANDVRFVSALLPAVRRRIAGPRLWLADRQFCDLEQPPRCSQEGDHWLVRYNKKVHFHPDSERKPRTGRDARGRRYREQWGWIGREGDQRRCYVRKITLSRGREETIELLTDLLDADAYPAVDLLEMYLQRWGIERMFQQVTEVFGLSALIGGSPEATLFQFALCLLMYNIIQVIRAYVASAEDRWPETISTEKLFADVQRELTACTVVWEAPQLAEFFAGPWRRHEVRSRLTRLLGRVWTDCWIKAKSYQRRPHPKVPRSKAHVSVYRILNDAKPLHSRRRPP